MTLTQTSLKLCCAAVLGLVLSHTACARSPEPDDGQALERQQRQDLRRERLRDLREQMLRDAPPRPTRFEQEGRPPPQEPMRKLSPEERRQLRQDLRNAGRDLYGPDDRRGR